MGVRGYHNDQSMNCVGLNDGVDYWRLWNVSEKRGRS